MIKKNIYGYLFFSLVVVSSSHARTQSYEPLSYVLKDKNYQFKLSESFFQTTGFFDNSRTSQPLPNGSSFYRLDSDLTFRKNMTKTLEFVTFGKFRSQNSEVMAANGVARSNSKIGFESLGLMLKHSLPPVERTRYSLEAGAKLATYRNPDFNIADPYGNLVLGDDVHELFFGGSVSYESSSKNYLNAKIHYNYPVSDLSQEFKYHFEGAMAWQKYTLLAGVQGIYTLGTDKYGDNTTAKPRQYTGATRLYNSINREYLAPFIGMNLGFNERWRVETKVASLMMGQSYDKGNEITLSLVYNSQNTTNEVSKARDGKFKTYHIEASVIKISPRGRYLRIDKGLTHDIEKGMKADLFEFDYLGGNKLLASGVVIEVGADSSVVKILSVHQNVEIKVGHLVRLGEVD